MYFSVLETVPHKTEPQVIDYFIAEESWANLCLCVIVCMCVAGTKNIIVFCCRGKRSLHDISKFHSKYINQMTVFSKYKEGGSRKLKHM